MTIRRRLELSFLAILLLFGANVGVYFWGTAQRARAFEDAFRAGERQRLILHIREEIGKTRLQLETTTQQADPMVPLHEAILGQIDPALDELRQEIAALGRNFGHGQQQGLLPEFVAKALELLSAWQKFVHNFGTLSENSVLNQVKAENLSKEVIDGLLEQIRVEEERRSQKARRNFDDVAVVTTRLTVGTFLASTLLSIAIAVTLSRRLLHGLADLKDGMVRIGGGELSHRIDATSSDEYGELGRSINEMATSLQGARSEVEARALEIERQRALAADLLRNILPEQVAAELQERGSVDPKYYEDVTVLFTDFAGFTLSTEKLAAEELVTSLHDYFTAFDRVIRRYGLEKLKTIGDAYMCVVGLPERKPSHAVDAVLASFEILREVEELSRKNPKVGWKVRIGIHTGPVIAGVVGIEKFAFDVWGETVNFASRMESACLPGHINLSERTWSRVKDFIDCEPRGLVLTKEKKEVEMWFARGILPALCEGEETPPAPFRRRYRTYFQKEPPAFPAFLLEAERSRRTGAWTSS